MKAPGTLHAARPERDRRATRASRDERPRPTGTKEGGRMKPSRPCVVVLAAMTLALVLAAPVAPAWAGRHREAPPSVFGGHVDPWKSWGTPRVYDPGPRV